jgi:rhodanese-related sulfurtransferase
VCDNEQTEGIGNNVVYSLARTCETTEVIIMKRILLWGLAALVQTAGNAEEANPTYTYEGSKFAEIWQKVSQADLLEITKDTTKLVVETPDGPIEILRQKNETQLISGFLRPIVSFPGVTPVGELEVLDALGDPDFIVVDMREPEWRIKATIPGSASIPFSDVAQRLSELGCSRTLSGWDCKDARNVVAFCNGPARPQSPIAIDAMVREGFSPEKLFYYRGGMQDRLVLGLTTVAVAA